MVSVGIPFTVYRRISFGHFYHLQTWGKHILVSSKYLFICLLRCLACNRCLVGIASQMNTKSKFKVKTEYLRTQCMHVCMRVCMPIVKRTCCSCRGLEFCSQHSSQVLPTASISRPRGPMPFGLQAYTYTYLPKHTYKKKTV